MLEDERVDGTGTRMLGIAWRVEDERRRRGMVEDTFGHTPHYQPTPQDGHDDYDCAAADRAYLLSLIEPARRCIFDGCVGTWHHSHGGFYGGYDNADDPDGAPIPFTREDPDPTAVRDYNGAALAPLRESR